MSVVGIDFGTHSSYVAVARQGGLETITNDYSLRATPSCAAFGSKTRQVGVAGRQQLLTNVKNTIVSFKNLIGRTFDDPVVQAERKWLAYELVDTPDSRRLGVKVNHLGQSRVFTPEQILAVLLGKLRSVTESYLKTKVTDCVIAVPCFWTDAQRRALLDAAKVAEINCLRVMNETTAVALNYGMYKELPDEAQKPRNVLFLDIGHSSTQAALVAFNKGKLKMLNVSWDLELGGRNFDDVLRSYFAEEFLRKYKVDARSNARAWVRLLDESEKIKKQMSANTNQIPLSIECFMEDKDVSATMKRADFEELSNPLWARIEAVLQRVLAEAKMRPGDVEVVELVGGGTRMPMVRTIVQNVVGRDPQTTLNQDEAVCRGCALQCAMLSPTFRVREFSMTDVQPYAIKLTWSTNADEGETEVFPERHAFPFSKMLTFYRKEPFFLDASYSLPNHVPYPTTKIGRFMINNVCPAADGDSSKVKVKVRLNANGVLAVLSASMYERQQVTEDEQAPPASVEPMEDADQQQTNEASPPPPMDADNGGDAPSPAGAENKDQQKTSAADNEPSAKQQPTAKTSQKVKVKSIDLPVTAQVPEMSDKELAKLRSVEHEMSECDRMESEKVDAKNALEEYVYEMRAKLGDQYQKFVVEQEATRLIGQLDGIEQWLYEDGDDQPKHVYSDRLAEFKKWGDPIVERYLEAQERPAAFDELGRCLQMARKAYEMFLSKDPKYDHVEPSDMEKVRKAIEEKQAWFEQNVNGQNRRPLTEPPFVFVSQIRSEKEAFEKLVVPIINKPKPKPKRESPPPAAQQQQHPPDPQDAHANGDNNSKRQQEPMETS